MLSKAIQPGEFSTGGGIDAGGYESESASTTVAGKRKVAKLNAWKDGKRKLNLNWADKRWNRKNWFALVPRTYLLGTQQLFLPAAEHFADFGERPGGGQIFLVVQNFHFPGELQEKLEGIQFAAGALDSRQFLKFSEVAGQQN